MDYPESPFLFRLRSNCQYAMDEILCSYIHMAALDEMNDIFEGKQALPSDLAYNRAVNTANPEYLNQYQYNFQSLKDSDLAEPPESIQDAISLFKSLKDAGKKSDAIIKKRHQIAAFTTNIHDPKMWGMYGGCFKGLAIVYDHQRIRSHVQASEEIRMEPIVYREKLRSWTLYNSPSTKTMAWKNENEIRLIRSNPMQEDHFDFFIPSECIKYVILGQSCQLKPVWRRALDKQGIIIFEASPDVAQNKVKVDRF